MGAMHSIGAQTPVIKTINSATVQTVLTATITPLAGTTQDLVVLSGLVMLQTPTPAGTWEAACVVNGAYAPGQYRQTAATGQGSYLNLSPTATVSVTHNGAAYPVRLDCWLAAGTGTANTTADNRYTRLNGFAFPIA